jgi:hypothetical protein
MTSPRMALPGRAVNEMLSSSILSPSMVQVTLNRTKPEPQRCTSEHQPRRPPTDGLRRRLHCHFVDSRGTAVGGRAEESIEERQRQLRHRGVGPPHLLVISDFSDERDELFAAVDREPNHAEIGASRKDSAENELGLRGPTGGQQAFGKQAFSPKRCAMPAATLHTIDPFLSPATCNVIVLP